MLRRQVQFALRVMQLRGQPLHLLAELPQHSSRRFSFLLGQSSVQSAPTAEHCLLDLRSDDGANPAEILANGFNFESGAHEEFEISLQVADLARGVRSVEPLPDEVKDVDLVCLLAVRRQRL
jgi:hypothetical protein